MTEFDPPVTSRPISGAKRLLFAVAPLLICLVFAEGALRILIPYRWNEIRINTLTTHFSAKRIYHQDHPELPYTFNPDTGEANSYGFRGPEISKIKPPGVTRIACLGASTTWGQEVKAEDAWPGRLEHILRQKGLSVEVINAGVPGWVSREQVINLRDRVLPLDPDIVIDYQGRNELFPQSFNHFKSDYSHYRNFNHRMDQSNYWHKELFRFSYLAMYVLTFRNTDMFGWSWREEEPVYGNIRFENQPTPQELIENLEDQPARTLPYRANVERMVDLCTERRIQYVLCTMAFLPDRFRANPILEDDPQFHPALARQLQRNNDVVSDIARERGLLLVDTAKLAARRDTFYDDCHVNEEGHRLRAEMVAESLLNAGLLKVEKGIEKAEAPLSWQSGPARKGL